MTLYKHKYCIESARKPGWDYSQPGYYFITICTHNRQFLFGNVIRGEMVLSEMGLLVQNEFEKSFVIRKELECDCYCIMPNHIHAVIVINDVGDGVNEKINSDIHRRDARPCVSMMPSDESIKIEKSVSNISHQTMNKPMPVRKPKSVSTFVAGFKMAVTKMINLNKTPKQKIWQARFYDIIIRDEQAYNNIVWYIKNNPKKWKEDRYNEHT